MKCKEPNRPNQIFSIESTKQAGAKLGQAQLKLGLDFISIFCRFGFTGNSLVELVWWIFLPSSAKPEAPAEAEL